jgi:hypothetical protein
MAVNFLKNRGCVTAYGGSGSVGAAKIEGFPTGTANAPILITGVTPVKRDLILPVTTLTNKKILYTFGTDFGTIAISGIVMLGVAGSPTDGMVEVNDWYESKRVGNKTSGAPVNISFLGKGGMKGYIIGLTIGQADPNINAIPFSITAVDAT